jgi:Tfp pilus assembly protein PilV
MKSFRIQSGEREKKGGFTLAEAIFSIGVFSFGFLSLAPMLALGLKLARQARDDRGTALVAQTLIEEAKQGTLASGTVYLDDQGTALNSSQAAVYAAQSTSQTATASASLTQLTLQITPLGAPGRVRIYAALFPTPPLPAP